MSYNAPGRWVSERLSSTTASENEQTSPNLSYVKPSRLPLGMPRSYNSYDRRHVPGHADNENVEYETGQDLPVDYNYDVEGVLLMFQ